MHRVLASCHGRTMQVQASHLTGEGQLLNVPAMTGLNHICGICPEIIR
jgi:hypothetical protein